MRWTLLLVYGMTEPPIANNSEIISWNKYDASDPDPTNLKLAQAYLQEFVNSRAQWAFDINKPIVLEEFGMARDAWRQPLDSAYKYDPSTPTSYKDQFYEGLYRQIEHLASQFRHAGSNFWAYGGLGRPGDRRNSFGMVWLGGNVYLLAVSCVN